MARSLRLSVITSSISQGRPQKRPPTITAEMMVRHDEKTSAGRAKILSGGGTEDRLTEVDEVLGCLVVQAVQHRTDRVILQIFNIHKYGT